MPFAQQMFLLAVAALAIGLVIYFAFFRPKWREELGDTGDLDPPRKIGKHPALGAGYRQGPTFHGGQRDDLYADLDEPWRRAEHNLRTHPPRDTVHPHPRPTDKRAIKHIVLTPRHLEHINIMRRGSGKPLLNAAGFRVAIAHQAVTSAPIHSGLDWLDYLIAYEVFSLDHQQARVAVEDSIVVAPGEPWNGQGGEFAGAGATSSFDDPDLGKVATQGLAYGSAGGFAAALGAGAALAGSLISPEQADPSDGGPEAYSPPQSAPEPEKPEPEQATPEPERAAPEPEPYQAPDPPASGGND